MNNRPSLVISVIFFLYFLLATPLGLFNDWVPLNIHTGFYSITDIDPGDDSGYYAYLRSIFFDGDIDFYNEIHYAHVEKFTSTGYVFNNWQIGQSIIFFPFFLLGHLWALVLNALNFPVSLDGYSFPYYMSTALAAHFYMFMGLLILFNILKGHYSRTVAFLSTLGVWLGSSLIYYTFIRQRMAHVPEFFSAILFLAIWLNDRKSNFSNSPLFAGILLAFLSTIRLINIAYIFIYLVDWFLFNYRIKGFLNEKTESIKFFLKFSGVFILGFLPQLFLWQRLNGVPFPNHITGMANDAIEDFNFQKYIDRLVDIFVGADWGIIYSMPLMILAVYGLFFLKSFISDSKPGLVIFFIFLLTISIVFPAPDAYGERYLFPAIPLLAFGLANFFTKCWPSKVFRPACLFFFLACVVAQYIMLVQYKTYLKYDDPKFSLLALSNIPTILVDRPDLLLRSSNFLRLLFIDLELNWTYKEFSYFVLFPFFQLLLLVFGYKIFCWLKKCFEAEEAIIKKKTYVTGVLIILSINITLIVVGPAKSKVVVESRKNYLKLKVQSEEAQKDGKIDEVIFLWDKAVKVVPEFWIAYLRLAISQEAKGLLQEANKNYEEALRLNSRHQLIKYHMAQNLVKLGEINRAEELLRLAIKGERQNSKYYQSLALLLARQSQFEEAVSLFEQTLTLKPDFGKAHFNFAILLMKLKRPQESIAHMKLAMDLGVKDPRLEKMAKFLNLKKRQ
jgi:tetratricopeptide (TPR) repeat protein